MPYRRRGESGVYAVRNLSNGKMYVGSSYDIEKRFVEHFGALRRGDHRCSGLQNAWNKYGQDYFVAEVLEFCETEDLEVREQFWLDSTKAADSRFGYNSRTIAFSNIGTKRSQETKDKIGAAHKGKIVPQHVRELVSARNIEQNSIGVLQEHLKLSGLASPNQKISVEDVVKMKELKAQGRNHRYIAKIFDVNQSTVSRAISGVTSQIYSERKRTEIVGVPFDLPEDD